MPRASRTAHIVPDEHRRATGTPVADAIASYHLSLRAANRSPATMRTYLRAMDEFARFLVARHLPQALPAITRAHIEAYIVSLQETGRRPATVSIAYRSLQPFFRWAIEEGEIEVSPMARMKPPVVPETPPPVPRRQRWGRLPGSADTSPRASPATGNSREAASSPSRRHLGGMSAASLAIGPVRHLRDSVPDFERGPFTNTPLCLLPVERESGAVLGPVESLLDRPQAGPNRV
jgi:hypothetical protein